MTLTSDILPVLCRAIIVASAGVLVGLAVCPLLGHARKGLRSAAWVAILMPYLTPASVVGYAYCNFSLSLVRHPQLNELFYVLLLAMRLVPVAAIVFHFAPSFVSPEALQCRCLLHRDRSRVRAFFSTFFLSLRGRSRALVVAFALTFLFAFGEFEMAARFGIRSWTVSLFDAQIGGLAIAESLNLVLAPALCEAIVLILVMIVLFLERLRPSHQVRAAVRGRGKRSWFIASYLVVAASAVSVIPLLIVLRGTARGIAALAEGFALTADIAASVVFASAAAWCAYLVAGVFAGTTRSRGTGKGRLVGACVLSVPGLLGPLVLSLFILWAFQQPALHAGYDTPVPLIITMILLLLPFAILLRILLHLIRPNESLHAAEMMTESSYAATRKRGAHLAATIRTHGRFWLIFLLFCWGYFDMTASVLLAPSKMMPVFARLYNFMHYGQISVLSGMVLLAMCVPLVLLALAGMTRSLVGRRAAHA